MIVVETVIVIVMELVIASQGFQGLLVIINQVVIISLAMNV
jgi:hypothetical protein